MSDYGSRFSLAAVYDGWNRSRVLEVCGLRCARRHHHVSGRRPGVNVIKLFFSFVADGKAQ
jgi:hypothetical protein